MKVNLSFSGFDELQAALGSRVPLELGSQAIASTMRVASRPMVRAMKQLAPVGKRERSRSQAFYDGGPGSTQRDVRFRALTRSQTLIGLIGVSKRPGRSGWRTHFIRQGIGGRGRARVGPRDFVNQAATATMAQVESLFAERYQSEAKKVFARNGFNV